MYYGGQVVYDFTNHQPMTVQSAWSPIYGTTTHFILTSKGKAKGLRAISSNVYAPKDEAEAKQYLKLGYIKPSKEQS